MLLYEQNNPLIQSLIINHLLCFKPNITPDNQSLKGWIVYIWWYCSKCVTASNNNVQSTKSSIRETEEELKLWSRTSTHLLDYVIDFSLSPVMKMRLFAFLIEWQFLLIWATRVYVSSILNNIYLCIYLSVNSPIYLSVDLLQVVKIYVDEGNIVKIWFAVFLLVL